MIVLSYLVAELRRRWETVRERPDAGYTTEQIIGIALMVAVGVTVLGIIGTKVLAKASGVDLGK